MGKRFPHVAIKEIEISPGDHIYTSRLGLIDHHGIYIEKDRVIHFQKSVEDQPFGSGSSSGGCGDSCGCGLNRRKSGVLESCLDCFLRGGKIYRYEYAYPAPYAGLKTWQTGLMKWSTSFPSHPPETVAARALRLLVRNDFDQYGVTNNNCEDFALYCKANGWTPGGQLVRIRSGQVVLAKIVLRMIITCLTFPFALVSDFNWEEFRIVNCTGDPAYEAWNYDQFM